jgi:predicted TIM-barrel fold metal-dependent hydrolase
MNTPVIDFHSHLGNWGRHAMRGDLERFIDIMDRAGIDKACVNCIFLGDARTANDLVAEFVARRPDRFIPVAFVTPHYPNEAIVELERAFDQLGAKFLKIYPDYFRKPNDDPAYFPIYEWLNERGLAVMSHPAYSFDRPGVTVMEKFAALSERFPNVKWVLAHAGGSGNQATLEVARDLPNVYLETCGSGAAFGAIEKAVATAGVDRLLFGTDMTLLDGRHQIGKVITADISHADKRQILGLNAIKLLGLEE